MRIRYALDTALLTALLASFAGAQELKTRPPASATPKTPVQQQSTIELAVPKGTPLEIALDRKVRVKKVGQEVHGRLVRPVYAFDRMVIPAGTDVKGHIAKIGPIRGKRRVFGILNANFTPTRKVEVEFNELQLADGRHIPFQAATTPGSGQRVQLVSAKQGAKKNENAAAKKVDEAKQQARQTWDQEMQQVKEPGKDRLEQFAMAQLPARPQYLRAGTVYTAELQQSLEFGSEVITPTMISSVGGPLPHGSLVHALLVTPLNSAFTQKGAKVEAVLSQPLLDGDRLILPEGTRLRGSVTEVRPARRHQHNGLLRIAFREVVLPNGIQHKVVAGLETVQADRSQNIKLDSEGGAEATSPPTRYASLGLSLALGTDAFRQNNDDDANQSGKGAAGGLAGFQLVGLALAYGINSQPVGQAMGAYGSARSVYHTFIAKGHDVVFPKDTPMDISLGAPRKAPLTASAPGGSTTKQKR
jgi:type IV secretory pathway VirB10-like protein